MTDPESDPQHSPISANDAIVSALIVLALAILIAVQVRSDNAPPPAAADQPKPPAAFAPPPESAIPDTPDGAAIRRGLALFEKTAAEGKAKAYVGNAMACRNCHLDAGRRPNAAPMWAAWGAYPKYRSKNGQIVTMEARIRDCFIYSMNAGASPSGGPPPLGSPIYADMMAYFHWLATGVPTGVTPAGAGYRRLNLPTGGYDRMRGKAVFEQKCVACHGPDGQGLTDESGEVLYPPLWGSRSFNWGAGMARVDRAASFIKENMPLGAEGSLTDQQAWDLAAWLDSHERPRDPRQTGSIAAAAKAHHANQPTFYGKTVDGHLLGAGPGAR